MSDYLSDYTAYDGPFGEHPPGVWSGIAAADKHLAEVAAKDQRIAELERDLADVTKQNDGLQEQHSEDLWLIDGLENEVRELRKSLAAVRGTR